ncbi:MAG TPA: hypothetical protein VFF21_08545 [Flavobacteriaceae bacterium]|nr:hypothetical protein [Flavobacteriaceae bacterium]
MQAVLVDDITTRNQFHKIPEIIYASDSNYIPHLRQDIDKIFDPKKNKLLKNGKAKQWIFKNSENQLVGRVAAFINPKTAYSEKQPTGGIGFFESINDQKTANFIFNTAKDWLMSEGMEAMDGPINLGERNQFWGLLTKNFEDPSSYGMNYNPEYYQQLWKNFGFKTYFNQYLYKRLVLLPVQEVFKRKTENLMADEDVYVTNIVGKPLEKVSEDFRVVYNAAWGGHDHFKPITKEVADKIINALKPVIDRRIMIFAFHNETPIGFFINIPELNEIFKYVNGNLNWLGKLKFLYHKWKQTPQTMVGIVFGVSREWQGKGVEGAMIEWAGDYITKNTKYKEIVMTWIGDFNPKMLKVCRNLGAERYREMKTYRYLFDRTATFERYPIIGS